MAQSSLGVRSTSHRKSTTRDTVSSRALAKAASPGRDDRLRRALQSACLFACRKVCPKPRQPVIYTELTL
jgi:hypothetical protein